MRIPPCSSTVFSCENNLHFNTVTDANNDDSEYVLSLLADISVEKFDTGASRCMSGDPHRLSSIETMNKPVTIVGFNDTKSAPVRCGLNNDDKMEYYVADMPSHLTLLCANAYCQEGCAVLFAADGLVLRMSESEVSSLREFISKYPVIKHLKVSNRTYEIADPLSCPTPTSVEHAFNSTASRYFNTKVNVSNQTERILTLLMTGLTFRDWHMHVKNKSLDGIPPDLTEHGMNRFEYRYGRTPDIIRLAHPLNIHDHTGLRTARPEPSRPGDRIEIDCMFSDYNIRESLPATAKKPAHVSTKKLSTHGGAIAGAVCVDCFSSFVFGSLLKSVAHPETFVERLLIRIKLDGFSVITLAADGGVVTNSMFQVLSTKVEELCRQWGVMTIERSEPYSHARITGSVEREIGLIQDLIRMAVTLILRNPNFPTLGFTPLMIYKLWGEFFLWAICVVNMKPCPRVPERSRYEVYYGTKPNMQHIRLLPIGCVIVVTRVPDNADAPGGVFHNQKSGQIGLYVGPSMVTPGCVRVAVVTRGVLKILTTGNFQSASDGGGLNIYPHIARGLNRLINEQKNEINVPTDVLHEPEEDVLHETEKANALPVNIGVVPDTPLSPIVVPEEMAQTNISPVSVPSPDSIREPPVCGISAPPSVMLSTSLPVAIADDFAPIPVRKSARQRERRERISELGSIAVDVAELETCCFADWSTYESECVYWSWFDFSYVQIMGEPHHDDPFTLKEEGYRAVTANVPKNFESALSHPLWGEPARKELNTLLSTKAMVEIDSSLAMEAIKIQNADIMYLFPVYEEKVKEGSLVYKVRLVADGRTHHQAGATYSATPSREEFFILFHIIAAFDWDYSHIDEVRAFLKAPYKGKNRAFVKFRGDHQYYEIMKALYGLKTAPRDYQEEVAKRLCSLGFIRLIMCSCIYVLKENDTIVIVYDYVDDFIFTGNSRTVIDATIARFRQLCETTEPIWDARRVLGMELERDRSRHIIKITMSEKIAEVCNKFSINTDARKYVPIPQSGYVIKDDEFDLMEPQIHSMFLNPSDITNYMAIVGVLIWISGLRMDILFSTMYLSWNTKSPRVHHEKMARCVLMYLNTTINTPLVLGGSTTMQITSYTDASLGTAPKGRSVVADINKLHPDAGAVSAHTKATQVVFTSSFEAELDGVTRGLKSQCRVSNIMRELHIQLADVPCMWSDNKAMVNFIHGEGVAKGVRHMELRMWYVRERYKQGNVVIDWMTGAEIPADKLTKLGTREAHEAFARDILGLSLLK